MGKKQQEKAVILEMLQLFLDKSDQRKIKLFRYLEEKPFLTENIETVIEELGFSQFLLDKAISELNNDFITYQLTEKFKLGIEGNQVTLIETGQATSNLLTEILSRNSIEFSLLLEIFFENFESVNDYAVRNFISYPVIYRRLKELRKALKLFHVIISKKFSLVGKEKNIRGLMSFYLTKIYGSQMIIYPEQIQQEVSAFIAHLMATTITAPISTSSENKLRHFLAATFLRIKQKNFLVDEAERLQAEKDSPITESYRNISSWLRSRKKIQEELILHVESQRLLLYLVGEELLAPHLCASSFETVEVKALNHSFSNTLKEVFPIAHAYEQNYQQKIGVLHFQLIHFQFEKTIAAKNSDITYFYETYPEYVQFCKQYIEKRRQHERIWQSKEFLFYNYLLILIETVPLHRLLPPIYVCIDFSLGARYNCLIKKNIQKISDLNIHYQQAITKETDLLLTDRPLDGSKELTQIIWLVPPRAVDWLHFTQQLLQIRKKLAYS